MHGYKSLGTSGQDPEVQKRGCRFHPCSSGGRDVNARGGDSNSVSLEHVRFLWLHIASKAAHCVGMVSGVGK